MEPVIIKGGQFSDARGTLTYNNDFDASVVKRIYTIQNSDLNFIRGWQGHKIEQRWFSAMQGTFHIRLIKVDDWDNPSKSLEPYSFFLDAKELDILHVPSGYISSIQAISENSKLLVMADYLVGEVKDEFRFDKDYFQKD
jgi:dTDP-4-dehydrorhamnose 3,5-epimerase-like enzyme